MRRSFGRILCWEHKYTTINVRDFDVSCFYQMNKANSLTHMHTFTLILIRCTMIVSSFPSFFLFTIKRNICWRNEWDREWNEEKKKKNVKLQFAHQCKCKQLIFMQNVYRATKKIFLIRWILCAHFELPSYFKEKDKKKLTTHMTQRFWFFQHDHFFFSVWLFPLAF